LECVGVGMSWARRPWVVKAVRLSPNPHLHSWRYQSFRLCSSVHFNLGPLTHQQNARALLLERTSSFPSQVGSSAFSFVFPTISFGLILQSTHSPRLVVPSIMATSFRTRFVMRIVKVFVLFLLLLMIDNAGTSIAQASLSPHCSQVHEQHCSLNSSCQ
jgi:hypothetical protein